MQKQNWILVDRQGIPIKKESFVTNLRLKQFILLDGIPPCNQYKNGCVDVTDCLLSDCIKYRHNPGNFGLKWVLKGD